MAVSCPFCHLYFQTDRELDVHVASIAHHLTLERKGFNRHVCALCDFDCESFSEYCKHVDRDEHVSRIEHLRSIIDITETIETKVSSKSPTKRKSVSGVERSPSNDSMGSKKKKDKANAEKPKPVPASKKISVEKTSTTVPKKKTSESHRKAIVMAVPPIKKTMDKIISQSDLAKKRSMRLQQNRLNSTRLLDPNTSKEVSASSAMSRVSARTPSTSSTPSIAPQRVPSPPIYAPSPNLQLNAPQRTFSHTASLRNLPISRVPTWTDQLTLDRALNEVAKRVQLPNIKAEPDVETVAMSGPAAKDRLLAGLSRQEHAVKAEIKRIESEMTQMNEEVGRIGYTLERLIFKEGPHTRTEKEAIGEQAIIERRLVRRFRELGELHKAKCKEVEDTLEKMRPLL